MPYHPAQRKIVPKFKSNLKKLIEELKNLFFQVVPIEDELIQEVSIPEDSFAKELLNIIDSSENSISYNSDKKQLIEDLFIDELDVSEEEIKLEVKDLIKRTYRDIT